MVTTGYIRTKRPNPRAAPTGHGRFIQILLKNQQINFNNTPLFKKALINLLLTYR